MTTLVIAEHNTVKLNDATAKTVTAAVKSVATYMCS